MHSGHSPNEEFFTLVAFERVRSSRLTLHRWAQWLTSSCPAGAYDGEWAEVREMADSLPAFLRETLVRPPSRRDSSRSSGEVSPPLEKSRPGRGGPGRQAVLVGLQLLMRILFFTVSSVLGRRTVRIPSL